MGIAAAVQPIKKGFLADFNQPATAHHRKPRCVYQLISTGSGNSHDMLNIRNIQNQGQRVVIIPLHFFFNIGVPPLFKFLIFHFPHIYRSTCSVSFMLPCSTYMSHRFPDALALRFRRGHGGLSQFRRSFSCQGTRWNRIAI